MIIHFYHHRPIQLLIAAGFSFIPVCSSDTHTRKLHIYLRSMGRTDMMLSWGIVHIHPLLVLEKPTEAVLCWSLQDPSLMTEC